MNRLTLIAATSVLCLLVAQASHAVIAVAVARGAVQSVSVSTSSVTIAGKSYAINRDTVIVGAGSLGQIQHGAHVTAILAPNGKQVMRLIVQQPGAPKPNAQH
jgi:hypothetical protein